MKPQESNHWFSFCTPTEFQSTREVPKEREIFYEWPHTEVSVPPVDFFFPNEGTNTSFLCMYLEEIQTDYKSFFCLSDSSAHFVVTSYM